MAKKRSKHWTSPSGVTYAIGAKPPPAERLNAVKRSASGYGNNLAAGTLSDAADRIVEANNGRHPLLRTIR